MKIKNRVAGNIKIKQFVVEKYQDETSFSGKVGTNK
jgi:hypothetical protein